MAEAPLSERAVYSARPTIRVDEQEHPRVSELLIAMELREREEGLAAMELRFSNFASAPDGGADFAFEDEASLRLGVRIAVYGGDENAPQEIFRGVVTGLEIEFPADGPPELIVLAEDALQQSRLTRRTRTHDDVSIADLARSLAAELGLTPVVTGFADRIGTHVQLNESDLAFLRRILARYDGDLQVVGRELHVSPRNEVRRGALELALHSQLRRARVLADLSNQVTAVTVTGWDPARGQRVSSRSEGVHPGPGHGRSGGPLLRDAIGERVHQIAHLAVATDAEGQAVADAAYDERARRFVCVSATSDGNPALRVGTHVTLSGMGPRFDNTYYVVSTVHRFDSRRGYETDFEAECAYLGEG